MSDKTSDKEVASLEIVIKDCREHLKIYGEAFITASELDRIENILAELEQKDKQIKELEEELEKANRQLDLDYVEENFIPKQQVKGKLKELKIERDKIYKEFIESNRLDKQLHVQGIYLDAQIIILQELLEGEK